MNGKISWPSSLVYFVSPYSNNAYKRVAPPGTIHVPIKGGAFLMPQQKLYR